MKKIAAILFVIIVLFNLYGYRVLIDYLQTMQESGLEANLDNNKYKDAELITVKLPINLPYYANSKVFERVNGSVEIDGMEYKYVKRRIFNDSIELACIPNLKSKEFLSLKIDFVKLGSEAQTTHQEKKSPNIKIASFDYCEKLLCFNLPFIMQKCMVVHTQFPSNLPSAFKSVQEQPPDLLFV